MTFQDEALPREKTFRDPILGTIIVDNQIILDLINTPEFQRLRRIKQLGTNSLTFHGAEHSRFGHCLGVNATTPLTTPAMGFGMIPSDRSPYARPSYTTSATVRTHTPSSTSSTPTTRRLPAASLPAPPPTSNGS